jgi:hypothetical protein
MHEVQLKHTCAKLSYSLALYLKKRYLFNIYSDANFSEFLLTWKEDAWKQIIFINRILYIFVIHFIHDCLIHMNTVMLLWKVDFNLNLEVLYVVYYTWTFCVFPDDGYVY